MASVEGKLILVHPVCQVQRQTLIDELHAKGGRKVWPLQEEEKCSHSHGKRKKTPLYVDNPVIDVGKASWNDTRKLPMCQKKWPIRKKLTTFPFIVGDELMTILAFVGSF